MITKLKDLVDAMLRINQRDTGESLPAYPYAEQGVDVHHLLRAMRRHLRSALALIGLFLALGVLALVVITPQYTATAQLLIDARQSQAVLDPNNTLMATGYADSSMVDSQVEVLKSERIASAVIDKVKYGQKEASQDDDPVAFLAPLFSLFASDAPVNPYEQERKVIEAFTRNLTVKRTGMSYVIEVAFRSADPQMAADVANSTANTYILDQLESKYEATRRAGIWMQDRLSELRDQALAADRAVQDYKSKNDLIDTSRGLVSDQQLQDLNTALIGARSDTAASQARLQRVEDILKLGQATGITKEAVGDSLSNPLISKLREQYLDAAKREADWRQRYGVNHEAVVNLRREMEGLQQSLFKELSHISETYRSDFEIAKAREASLQQNLDNLVNHARTTGQAQVKLRELESTAQSYRALYDNFLQRYMQASQQQSFPITEARVITDAAKPLKPSAPKAILILAGSLVLGLAASAGMIFLRETGNKTFRSAADIEQYLHLDCLGVLPRLTTKAPALKAGQTGFDSTTGPMRQVVADPFSRFAETLRSVKVSADVSGVGHAIKVFGIVSTLPKEGKSTISANFAQLIAHGGSRCVLVDLDLRNPSLTKRLWPGATKGVLELVHGKAKLSEASLVDPVTGLTFIPAVVPGHIVHTNELMASPAMKTLLDQLKTSFDYVVVDLPPLAPVVDVLASTHLVDTYVYVLEWGSTNRELVETTLMSNRKVRDKLLGCVLNKVNLASLRRLEDYGSKYHHHKYHIDYGADR